MASALHFGLTCYRDKYPLIEETFPMAVEYFVKNVHKSRRNKVYDSYLDVIMMRKTQPIKDYFDTESMHGDILTEEHWKTIAHTVWVMDDCYM